MSNSEQNDRIILALESAIRAGFSVTFRPGATGGAVVAVATECAYSGQASARVQPFAVARDELRDAAGQALGTLLLEIGLDRLERARAVAAE